MPSQIFLAAVSLAGNFNFSWLSLRDVIDVVVIAILIYVGLRLLLETHSWPMLIGIIAVALLYAASNFFNLPLTHLVLRAFFGFFIIFIAIIFQKELRRLLSFVGFFSFKRVVQPADSTLFDQPGGRQALGPYNITANAISPGALSHGNNSGGGGGSIPHKWRSSPPRSP